MLKVVIPQSKDKIRKQIAALQWQIKNDTDSQKDLEIHQQALLDLERALKNLS